MDDETYAFAVATAAEIEVLRAAVVMLTAVVMGSVPSGQRESVLDNIRRAAGDLPPRTTSPNPKVTKFYEDIAALAPRHAEMFVDHVRNATQ